jgi:hypothetical protein
MGDTGTARLTESPATIDSETFECLEDLFALSSSNQRPGSPFRSAPESHQASPHGYAPTNAVHMEIQENAKLPTFNLYVDRSNSGQPSLLKKRSSNGQYAAETSHDLEEIVRLSKEDLSLTESFLESHDRSSRNMNYSSAGALLGSVGDRLRERDGKPNLSPASAKATSGLLTPPASPVTLGSPLSPPFPMSPTMFPSSYYPYGRLNPLPIPTKRSPVPEHESSKEGALAETSMQEALRTAAALAQNGHSTTANCKSSLISSNIHPAIHSTKSNPVRPGAGRSHSSPTQSILEATKRRSQFGFGENHVVPSVPLPPPNKKNRAGSITRPANGAKMPSVPALSSSLNAADAYERKKQRAKDARIRLNESIDRLGVAINLAGSQSKERASRIRSLAEPVSSESSRKSMLEVMDKCVEEAEGAKKWDRPSFVGSAASMVQALNAQCEALTRELLMWKAQACSNGANTNGKRKEASKVAATTTSTTKKQRVDSDKTVVADMQAGGHFGRLEEGKRTFASLGEHVRATTRIASFLDARSLLRCLEVSKTWRDLDVFQSYDAWIEEAINRFGSFPVRQWKVKLDDHAQELSSCPIKLYKTMDSANVSPYTKEEGTLILGKARIPGKVSAWVSMAERSNGETFRSVRKESPDDSGEYSSLPVVELRILVQNTGMTQNPVVLKDQAITVDASTRRRGEEMQEIQWDDRLAKSVLNLDGSIRERMDGTGTPHDVVGELCRLRLYDSVVLVAHVHARGCSTTSRFQHKANFTTILVTINGTTVPLVIPFFRDTIVNA